MTEHIRRSSGDGAPRQPTIFGFGSAAIDFRIRTADLGRDYRAKLLARQTEVLGGGAVANALVQASRLGGRTAFLGKLGTDWIGDRIVAGLEAEGVDCAAIIRQPDTCSPFNLAAYAGEDRRRVGGFLLPNSLGNLSEGEVAAFGSRPGSGDLLLVELGEIPLAACIGIAGICRENAVRILLDVDLDPVSQCGGSMEEFAALARASDLVLPNRDAMESLYPGLLPERLAHQMARDLGRTVIVTAGEDGAYCCDPGGKARHQPAFPANVVDTVGAGDAFHGGVVFALSTGATLEEAVELGARCGTANCSAAGAREGMPTAQALDLKREEVKHDGL